MDESERTCAGRASCNSFLDVLAAIYLSSCTVGTHSIRTYYDDGVGQFGKSHIGDEKQIKRNRRTTTRGFQQSFFLASLVFLQFAS